MRRADRGDDIRGTGLNNFASRGDRNRQVGVARWYGHIGIARQTGSARRAGRPGRTRRGRSTRCIDNCAGACQGQRKSCECHDLLEKHVEKTSVSRRIPARNVMLRTKRGRLVRDRALVVVIRTQVRLIMLLSIIVTLMALKGYAESH
jgi:hypothetical protein